MKDHPFPPIKSDLVDNLTHQAAQHTTTLDEAEGTPKTLPDVTSHVAHLVLALLLLCLYVPLIAFINV
jgi:hypothetical protein